MLNRFASQIPAFIKFILKFYVLTFSFFFLYRLLFFIFNKPINISEVPYSTILSAFEIGILFDNTMFSYITFLPLLLLSISYFIRNKLRILYNIAYISYVIFIPIYLFICAADIPYYAQFGSHLNKTALMWSESPAFMLEMIFSNVSYWGFLIIFLMSLFLFYVISKKIYNSFTQHIKTEIRFKLPYAVILFLVIVGLTILGARGRTSSKQVLHEGLSIISTDPFINQIALNPNYTFWKSLLKSKNSNTYQVPKNINEDIAFTRNYLGISGSFEKNIDRQITPDTIAIKHNIIIVIMESTSVYKMGYYGGKNLTPNLHALNKEAVFCETFFSSGIHTFNGLFSTTTGFPSIYNEKGLRSYIKKPFNGLGTMLHNDGYDTYFYTTHDPHFDNMEGFYKLNGYEHFINEHDFNADEVLSNCGIPDHKLFDKLIETHSATTNRKPFLSVLMTGSDHGPWKIPTDIPYKPNGANEQENCTLYADWSIGQFIAKAKKQSWFNNTIFIFLGDHGLTTNNTYEMPLSFNHIPCIIYQPNLLKADTIKTPCYQADIPATVMGLLNLPYTNQTFGINVLKEKHPFVVFSADDKIGCVDANGYFYYKTLSNNESYLRSYKTLDQTNYVNQYKAKADSMNKNMMMIYESAHYLIRENYFLYE